MSKYRPSMGEIAVSGFKGTLLSLRNKINPFGESGKTAATGKYGPLRRHLPGNRVIASLFQ
jgi:hypothetical protein